MVVFFKCAIFTNLEHPYTLIEVLDISTIVLVLLLTHFIIK